MAGRPSHRASWYGPGVSVFCHAADLGFVKPLRSFSSDFLAGKRATDEADGQAGTGWQIRQELGVLWFGYHPYRRDSDSRAAARARCRTQRTGRGALLDGFDFSAVGEIHDGVLRATRIIAVMRWYCRRRTTPRCWWSAQPGSNGSLTCGRAAICSHQTS